MRSLATRTQPRTGATECIFFALNPKSQTSISAVLQSDEIFTSAIQGEIAQKKVLAKAFPKMNKDQVIKFILEKGEMQIGEKERDVMLENSSKEILTIVQSKLVHTDSKRPYSLEAITAACKSMGLSCKMKMPPKKQALYWMKLLQKKYYVSRAEMKIQIRVPAANLARLAEKLKPLGIDIQSNVDAQLADPKEEDINISCNIDPSKFRDINEVISSDNATLEILEQAIVNKDIGLLEDAGHAG